MKLDADQIIKTIDDQKFKTTTKTVTKATFKNKLASVMKPLIKFIQAQLKKGELGQANLKVEGTDLIISLEINVINMPYTSIRPLKRLITKNGMMPATVNIMMSNPRLNRSKFRIDQFATATEMNGTMASLLLKIQTWLKQQVAQEKSYQTELRQKAKRKTTKKTTKRTTRRRTTRRKATRRRKTTRKRTATKRKTTRKATKKAITRRKVLPNVRSSYLTR